MSLSMLLNICITLARFVNLTWFAALFTEHNFVSFRSFSLSGGDDDDGGDGGGGIIIVITHSTWMDVCVCVDWSMCVVFYLFVVCLWLCRRVSYVWAEKDGEEEKQKISKRTARGRRRIVNVVDSQFSATNGPSKSCNNNNNAKAAAVACHATHNSDNTRTHNASNNKFTWERCISIFFLFLRQWFSVRFCVSVSVCVWCVYWYTIGDAGRLFFSIGIVRPSISCVSMILSPISVVVVDDVVLVFVANFPLFLNSTYTYTYTHTHVYRTWAWTVDIVSIVRADHMK